MVGWAPAPDAPAGGWASVFAVYAGDGDVPPMLGTYAVENGELVFRPRFPLAPGVRMRAIFHAPGATPIETVFETPKADARPSAHVEKVYPSADILPANQLKFYVCFSAPMSRGEAWQHIRLLDSSGAPVDLPFLEIQQELWDRDYRRLTVLFDPGRIKRGVTPREEIGPAIEPGKQYTLLIGRDWRDGRGAPLEREFRKAFRVGPEDRAPVDPKQWRLKVPKAGASEPLVVEFPKPMDYALLLRVLEVADTPGTATVGRNETQWRFVPDQPWQPGDHRLLVDTSLEDLAGNRIGRAFEVDTFAPVSRHLSRETVSLPFRTRR